MIARAIKEADKVFGINACRFKSDKQLIAIVCGKLGLKQTESISVVSESERFNKNLAVGVCDSCVMRVFSDIDTNVNHLNTF